MDKSVIIKSSIALFGAVLFIENNSVLLSVICLVVAGVLIIKNK